MVLALASCGVPTPSSGTASDQRASAASTAVGHTLTLITGDRVTLVKANGRSSPQIRRGPGREAIAFSILEREGELTVLPQDAAGLVRTGRLDPGLFNVTRLLADGYGDDRRDDLPLIVTGASELPALGSRMASAGIAVDRSWPGLHAMAVRQRKSSAGGVLASLGSAAPGVSSITAAGATARIWLDRRRHVVLDHSVPQIGAPAAYARGLTGTGVAVAVLDTGIDATHPDLAGKITAAETFLDDGLGASDVFGHGTHVASIVAGTGAASGGQFHGVAPDATLLSGRVCDQFGDCPDSAILAGMEWAAVTQHARIVNLSLGATDAAGVDPLEDAVNQLSAQYGTLFVVAAGNSGPRGQSLGSPGSADAALTVGAVDRDDQLAEFSSRGPRLGDRAIKPDITAPGVEITAARAAGTQLGPPVGDFYVQLSGTSMATPHVAGAAALLLQQHPDWTGEQLKDQLIGTAQPNEALTVYQQGAGRVDVDRATRQAVSAEPASLSLGIASFPHGDDPPIARTVRYRNAGSNDVTLTLATTLSTNGVSASPGTVTVAPSTLTVPAGGSAEATVTVDTRVEGPDGVYGGALIAAGDGVRVITPLGVERELESHDLTVRLLGRDGQASAGTVSIFGLAAPGDPVADVHIFDTPVTAQATFHLPRGTYTVESFVSADDIADDAMLIAPRVAIAADTTLVTDGRAAQPIDLTLPQSDLVFIQGVWDYEDTAHGISFAVGGPVPLATGEIEPSAAPGEIHSSVNVAFASDTEHPSDVFNLARLEHDHFVAGWHQTLGPQDLATVHARHAGADDQILRKVSAPIAVAGGFFAATGFSYTGPFQRTEHYYGPEFLWLVELSLDAPIAIEDAIQDYRAGQVVHESWNQAPFGPAFAGRTLFSLLRDGTGAPARKGDTVAFAPSMFSGQAVPARNCLSLLEYSRMTLRRDGQILAESTDPFLPFLELSVPPEPSQYVLDEDVTRASDPFTLSPHVTATWTFRSQHVDGDTQHLPLPTLRFFPSLDEHNQSDARVLVLPIRIERPVGAPTPAIARASVETSFDGGATWAPVPIVRFGDQAIGLIVHPRHASHVSLRGSAADVDGNAVTQTIVRAYALAPHR